jgi:hypothetical protein
LLQDYYGKGAAVHLQWGEAQRVLLGAIQQSAFPVSPARIFDFFFFFIVVCFRRLARAVTFILHQLYVFCFQRTNSHLPPLNEISLLPNPLVFPGNKTKQRHTRSPLILLLMLFRGELTSVWAEPDLYNPGFLVVVSLSGLVAFAISFSVLWFMSNTTPTTFSLVVSLFSSTSFFCFLILFLLPLLLYCYNLGGPDE